MTILYGRTSSHQVIEGGGVISTIMSHHFIITLTTPLSSQLNSSKYEALNQWWYNVGPTLKTVYQHYHRFNAMCLLRRSIGIRIIFTQYIQILLQAVFVFIQKPGQEKCQPCKQFYVVITSPQRTAFVLRT